MFKKLALLMGMLLFAGGVYGNDFTVAKSGDIPCPRLEVCFSPLQDCSQIVLLQLAAADKTVDLALYSLTKDNIAEAIIATFKRGVKVRLVIDKTQAAGRNADDEKLEAAGIPVKRMRGMKSGLMHHKFAIIDGKTILTGSYNWTKGGTYKNSENLIVMDDLIMRYQIEFDTLWNKTIRKRKKK